jgi:Na+/proline symporter
LSAVFSMARLSTLFPLLILLVWNYLDHAAAAAGMLVIAVVNVFNFIRLQHGIYPQSKASNSSPSDCRVAMGNPRVVLRVSLKLG